MSGEQCTGCRFWLLDETTRDPNDTDWGFGSCRVLPPVVLASVVAMQMPRPAYAQMIDPEICSTDVSRASVFPVTFATEWCGRFERPNQGASPC